MKIFSVGGEVVHADGQTDVTKLSRFSKFCERT